MKPRQIIGIGITASAMAHLSVLILVAFFSDVHPFGSVTAEPIAVDIVAPEQVAENKPEPLAAPKAEASDGFNLSATAAAAVSPVAAAPPDTATPPQTQAAASARRPNRQQAAAQPPPPKSAMPAYTPPEPDLSVKYHVMLGLPPDIDVRPAGSGNKPGDAFDDEASKAAHIASTLVPAFRPHLRACSKLPEAIAPSDTIPIK